MSENLGSLKRNYFKHNDGKCKGCAKKKKNGNLGNEGSTYKHSTYKQIQAQIEKQ